MKEMTLKKQKLYQLSFLNDESGSLYFDYTKCPDLPENAWFIIQVNSKSACRQW